MQRTLKTSVITQGIGLHSGRTIHMEIRPASGNTGIVFQRTDLPGLPYIPAKPQYVVSNPLATRLSLENGVSISTIEHLMSAFYGFGIDNAIVAVDGPEIPILDGSAAPFLVLLDKAGIEDLAAPQKVCVVEKTLEVVDEKDPTRFIRIEPCSAPWLSYTIDFPGIGKQEVSMPLDGAHFCEKVAFARTFCMHSDVQKMQSLGLARGGSLDNALVVAENGHILNQNGLRHPEEFVLHKALDCVGDLFLLGAPLFAHVMAHKAGHDLHTRAVQLLQSQWDQQLTLAVSKFSFTFPKKLDELKYPLLSKLVSG